MTTKNLFGDDGRVDADKVASLRRGDLLNAVEDLETELAEAKADDDGSAKAGDKRRAAAERLREFRRWQRDNGATVDPDAVNINPAVVSSNSHAMNEDN